MIRIVKVSVVVPVYNGEKYIGRCIESILNQNLKDLELILVNDGSTDNSLATIKKYAYYNKNIKIITKSNGGVSSARNAGIKAATGDYIGFVDSDDWIDPEMYRSMYTKITDTESDICMCNYIVEYPDHKIGKSLKTNKSIIYKEKSIHQLIINMIAPRDLNIKSSSIMGSACRLLVKREFIQESKIKFPLGIPLMEDLIFCTNAFIKCNKISFDKGFYYHYFIESMTPYRHDMYCIHKNVFEILEGIFKENNMYTLAEPRLNIRYVNMCNASIYNVVDKMNKNSLRDKLTSIKNICSDNKLKDILKNTSTKKYKIRKKMVLYALKHQLTNFLYLYYKITSYKNKLKFRTKSAPALNREVYMRKIAIITLNGYYNYGNRLQNYALQETLKTLGFLVETLVVNTRPQESYTLSIRIINLFINSSAKEIMERLKYKIFLKKKIDMLNEKRSKVFKDFTYQYIKETDHVIYDDNIPDNLRDKYDYFIVGSDQVWNPAYTNGSSIYFLTFAKRHKRIAYAASFGVSEIEAEYLDKYKKWISEMHFLSIRENDGAGIIKKLIGRDAPVLVDPTLLLTKEQWLSIAKRALNKPKGDYIVTYFLGGIPDWYREQINRFAINKNFEIVNLGDMNERESYKAGPSEFIDYISDCSALLTDSFHGTIFSIIFEKPFAVFERIGGRAMNSRIETLLSKFELNSRSIDKMSMEEDLLRIDFSHIPYILETERKKSIDYLKNALDIKDVE